MFTSVHIQYTSHVNTDSLSVYLVLYIHIEAYKSVYFILAVDNDSLQKWKIRCGSDPEWRKSEPS